MSKSINPMLFLKPDTGPFPARSPCHRLDEFADGYSLTGCSPALPVSASPASHHSRADTGNLSTVHLSLSGLSRTVKANYQYIGGPLLMIEVGQSGVSNSVFSLSSDPAAVRSNAAPLNVAIDSAGCSNTTGAPHEYFY
jgi:hypothetical protein